MRLKIVTLILLMVLMVLGYLGFHIFHSDGYLFRTFSKKVEMQAKDLAGRSLDRSVGWICQDPKFQGGNCLFSGNPETVVVGDSHAPMVYLGLLDRYLSAGNGLGMVEVGGCPPLLRVVSRHTPFEDGMKCQYRNTVSLQYLLAMPSIHEIILVSRGPLYVTGKAFGYSDWIINFKNEPIRLKSNPLVFEEALEKTINQILHSGKTVSLVLDTPELNFDIKSCLQIRPFSFVSQVREPCAILRKDYDARSIQYRQIIQRVTQKFPTVKVIDPIKALCDENYCYAKKGDLLLYVDDNHLSERGARYIFGNRMDRD